jgi:outer membrane lipoprotein SlyB
MATLKITGVTCVKPSTGVAGYANNIIGAVTSAIGGSVGAAIGAASGPGAVLAAAGGGAAGAAVGSLISGVAESIGQDIRDELYIKVNGDKVWPTDADSYNVNSGDTVYPNYETSINGQLTVTLMEWDFIGDDNLGEHIFDRNSQSGVYMFFNPDEGDLYAVSVELS